MTVLRFGNVEVRIDSDRLYMETVFFDGTTVPSAPNYRDEDVQTARGLGYTGDGGAVEMWRDHDVLHSFLAHRMGLGYSPTLWAVAHEQGAGCIPEWKQWEEEDLVCSFQRYLNNPEDRSPVLDRLAEWSDLAAIRQEALLLLRPEDASVCAGLSRLREAVAEKTIK